MRKLIVSEFITVDGVAEAPGGEPGHPHTGWVFDFVGPEQERFKLTETQESESLQLGRVTYEGFAEAWPGRSGPFAEKMNEMPKHVVSTTLRDPEWSNTTVIDGDVAEEVGKLKDGEGGPILVAGSISLVQHLIDHELVDEYRLMVFPVILGSGRRLFGEREEKLVLSLVDTQAFETGVQVSTYRAG